MTEKPRPDYLKDEQFLNSAKFNLEANLSSQMGALGWLYDKWAGDNTIDIPVPRYDHPYWAEVMEEIIFVVAQAIEAPIHEKERAEAKVVSLVGEKLMDALITEGAKQEPLNEAFDDSLIKDWLNNTVTNLIDYLKVLKGKYREDQRNNPSGPPGMA